MIVRVVVGVVLAAALLAATTPALDAARTDRGAQVGATETARLLDAVGALVERSDPTPPDAPGAVRRLAVRIPPPSLTFPRVSVFLDPPPAADVGRANRSRVGYRVNGRTHATRTRLPLATDAAGRRLTVESGERARLALRYVRSANRSMVRVARDSK
ncbi:DUF7311 family protein [Halocalculus aciditolerans]|uniref:DUF7311 domain-containing protein n=1 Tax=Halocalculus aciditolerans TaxID=1383812 RepID=A0A830FG89_9EURY|nr:hypothetical protein [Halocalculus aciditolerans]GGL72581.1 hypothetical protein GCM10009039_33200 [Halocalculus aciditolerans]